MEILHTRPESSAFIPLVEHQSRTPESFYTGPPVLHFHSDRCKLIILESDLVVSPAFNAMCGDSVSNGNTINGSGHHASHERGQDEEQNLKEVVIDDIEVWVASDKFTLYRAAVTTGISIPYPLISLHAIQSLRLSDSAAEGDNTQGLYMQIEIPSTETTDEDEEENAITFTFVPPSETTGTEMAALPTAETETEGEGRPHTITQSLFAAVSACSNLHPDPAEDDNDDDYRMGQLPSSGLLQAGSVIPGRIDGGLPPSMDGSFGWITADNLYEYFDEEGNWIRDGEAPSMSLGPNAGAVRPRENNDENEEAGGGEKYEETKWRRTG